MLLITFIHGDTSEVSWYGTTRFRYALRPAVDTLRSLGERMLDKRRSRFEKNTLEPSNNSHDWKQIAVVIDTTSPTLVRT